MKNLKSRKSEAGQAPDFQLALFVFCGGGRTAECDCPYCVSHTGEATAEGLLLFFIALGLRRVSFEENFLMLVTILCYVPYFGDTIDLFTFFNKQIFFFRESLKIRKMILRYANIYSFSTNIRLTNSNIFPLSSMW